MSTFTLQAKSDQAIIMAVLAASYIPTHPPFIRKIFALICMAIHRNSVGYRAMFGHFRNDQWRSYTRACGGCTKNDGSQLQDNFPISFTFNIVSLCHMLAASKQIIFMPNFHTVSRFCTYSHQKDNFHLVSALRLFQFKRKR